MQYGNFGYQFIGCYNIRIFIRIYVYIASTGDNLNAKLMKLNKREHFCFLNVFKCLMVFTDTVCKSKKLMAFIRYCNMVIRILQYHTKQYAIRMELTRP